MRSSRMASGEGLREETRIYEEKFKTEMRETVKLLFKKQFRIWKEVHPLIPNQEKFLGYDDMIEWTGEHLVLGPVSPLQSCIQLSSPTLVQYKAPLTELGLEGLVYPISIPQYLLMRAHQHFGESAFYALAKVRTRAELQEAKYDVFKLAYWVEPMDLNIGDFSYDEYHLHVSLEAGKWFTKPNLATLLPVPLDPDPAKIRIQMEKAKARLGLPRSKDQSPEIDAYQRTLRDIKIAIQKIRQPGLSSDVWKKSEVRE
jgi:hypothetical protein